MSTLFPHAIQVISRTGSRVNGRWSETSETRTVTGSVQPVSGKETQFLPESRRDSGVVKIYCNENLNVSEHEKNNANGENVHNHLRRKDYAFI